MHNKPQKYFTAKGYFFYHKVARRFSLRTQRTAKGWFEPPRRQDAKFSQREK